MHRIGKIILLGTLLMGVLLFSPVTIDAQFTGNTDITVNVSPTIPGPNEEVVVTLTSLSVNLDTITIRWEINGKTELSGVGEKTLTFKTGGVGSTTTIEASIDVPGVPTITKRIVIQPLAIDLLWEATDSYTPPFYKGKALLPSEGVVKVVAIPEIKTTSGKMLKPSDFTYTWNRNQREQAINSGNGRNYFSFQQNYLTNEEVITVTAKSVSGNYQATKKVTITPRASKVLFYEFDPALGVRYERMLQDITGVQVNKEGLIITAEPYYFSANTADTAQLSFEWNVNNEEITSPTKKHMLPVQVTTNGVAEIRVKTEARMKLFQEATRSLFVNLEANE
ncbi:MAG: hypothetical protein MUD00_00705 [Candidatus Pacebacteria bacterium]|jgi:hypothetical protein|nr:hypothetical protein [Candidatus Paceibacterota bacterium]